MAFDEARREAVEGRITEALDRAVALAFLVTAGLVAAGHLGLSGATFFVSLVAREPVLAYRITSIAAWDLGISFLVLNCWKKRLWNSRSGEALLTLIASLVLWRVLLGVGINLTDTILPGLLPSWAIAYAPPLNADLAGSSVGLAGLWLFSVALCPAKEAIARMLFASDNRHDSPLCSLLAWHHRKDAVFTLLGTIAATVLPWGVSPRTAGVFVAVTKLLLLGSASLAIFHRCVFRLLGEREDEATSSEMRDRMKPEGEDEERG